MWFSNNALCIHPKELKTYVLTQTCTRMFTADFFIITKIWKQPRCPSLGEWMNKLWYIHAVAYYSPPKWRELPHHGKMWRTPEAGMCITKWKRLVWTGYLLHDYSSTTVWERQSYGDSEGTVTAKGSGGRRSEVRAQRMFRAVKLHCAML